MSRTPTAFPGELPAGLRCGFCQKPIDGVFYRTLKRFACAQCAAEAEEIARRNEFDAKSFAIAASAGLGAALLFAAAWAAIVHITHWQIGIIAIFMGTGIAKAVRAASKRRGGIYLQWLSGILAAFSVALGQLGVVFLQFVAMANEGNISLTSARFWNAFVNGFVLHPERVFSAIDLVWIGLAFFGAWRLSKPAKIVVSGPYIYQPNASTDGLQFQTVEPADAAPPFNQSRPA